MSPGGGTGATRYRVAAGFQVHHEGRFYAEGEEFEAPTREAREWLARGYVEEAPAKPAARRKGAK